ncbi:hypothetical protein LTR97_005963 [Elasticomyces elasticus]|uniref:DUF2828 domain-containing protein n=1 Tax=Elasticomyces elasticus TaxID=574655 RepID=A0AAN7ZU07_9PEZI|nr:hypothetical protein LTR97_005963 [Elasticomyces elasticus]
MAEQVKMAEHTMINTTFPVDLPDMPELRMAKPEFEAYIKATLYTTILLPTSTQDKIELPIHTKQADATVEDSVTLTPKHDSRFMDGLLADKSTVPTFDERDGKMLTENLDVAHRTSGEALVDLFQELEAVISGDRLSEVLENAWTADSEATLKIIWNARSIHLGKSDRITFYRSVGWLAEKHPLTLLTNLPWLVRPLIPKKTPKPKEQKEDKEKKDDVNDDAELIEAKDADSDFEIVDEPDELDGPSPAKRPRLDDDAEPSEFDVRFGVAHGYWKDLLNILALAANDELKAGGNPRSVLNIPRPTTKVVKAYEKDWTAGRKKLRTADKHEKAVKKLADDPFYRALHLTVARLFADQLKLDYARLQSDSKAEIKRITLAAKWAPSHKGMHDQHTFIVSSIAELLYPFDSVCPQADPGDRTLYLKHARNAYQLKLLSPLRKALDIVERSLTNKKFDEISYNKVPSLAMKQYTSKFAEKDFERFDQYIDKVASGQLKISGATLLPSTLVAAVSGRGNSATGKGTSALVQKKLLDLAAKTVDGQWNTLVQRIKDNGTLESSIAVCDVSGSMSGPVFPDGTCPMDSAIGLSLLLAEITKPPFGGALITFHEHPMVVRVGGLEDKHSFVEKVNQIKSTPWGGSTDFVAVFERLILPMAVENKLTQEDMVKQVFVFSDMQFNMAGGYGSNDWSTSYERIQKKFKVAGYEMPKLIFWNLAGGRAGYSQYGAGMHGGDDVAPKPVTAADEGTALVSGYSQGQLKMFLDNGQFDEPEDEVVEEEAKDGDEVVVKKVKAKQDPLATVKKAISHAAYRMLKVVD